MLMFLANLTPTEVFGANFELSEYLSNVLDFFWADLGYTLFFQAILDSG